MTKSKPVLSPRQLEVALKMARSLWREARILTAGGQAGERLTRKERRIQALYLARAKELALCRETIAGALYFVVLTSVAAESASGLSSQGHYYKIAETLNEVHGFDVSMILDAAYATSHHNTTT